MMKQIVAETLRKRRKTRYEVAEPALLHYSVCETVTGILSFRCFPYVLLQQKHVFVALK